MQSCFHSGRSFDALGILSILMIAQVVLYFNATNFTIHTVTCNVSNNFHSARQCDRKYLCQVSGDSGHPIKSVRKWRVYILRYIHLPGRANTTTAQMGEEEKTVRKRETTTTPFKARCSSLLRYDVSESVCPSLW